MARRIYEVFDLGPNIQLAQLFLLTARRLAQKKIFEDELVLAGRKGSGTNRARYLVI